MSTLNRFELKKKQIVKILKSVILLKNVLEQNQDLQKELASAYAKVTQAQSELLSTKASLRIVRWF